MESMEGEDGEDHVLQDLLSAANRLASLNRRPSSGSGEPHEQYIANAFPTARGRVTTTGMQNQSKSFLYSYYMKMKFSIRVQLLT